MQRGYVTAARQEGQRKTSESSDVVKEGMWRGGGGWDQSKGGSRIWKDQHKADNYTKDQIV